MEKDAVKALLRFGSHKKSCPGTMTDCTCGFAEAIVQAGGPQAASYYSQLLRTKANRRGRGGGIRLRIVDGLAIAELLDQLLEAADA